MDCKKLKNLALLTLLAIFFVPVQNVLSTPLKESVDFAKMEVTLESKLLVKGNKKAITKHEKRVGRKFEKLRKKLTQLQQAKEEKKGKPLLIIGGILLLIGIIMMATIQVTQNNSNDLFAGCAQLFFGILIATAGIILLIVGAFV